MAKSMQGMDSLKYYVKQPAQKAAQKVAPRQKLNLKLNMGPVSKPTFSGKMSPAQVQKRKRTALSNAANKMFNSKTSA